MEAILLKNQIHTKVEKLTAEQLLLVNDFVMLVEKTSPKKQPLSDARQGDQSHGRGT